MAQVEEMKRLLLKGKIVGYQLHTFTNSEGIYHSRTSEIINYTEKDGGGSDLELGNNILFAEGNTTEGLGFSNYIEHDSFELGIKQDKDRWWFEGDRGKHKVFGGEKYNHGFVLVYSKVSFSWEACFDDISYGSVLCDTQFLSESECVDNIHEKA